jgi:hypothetical protein
MHAVIREKLWPPVAEVALPFAVVVNLYMVLGLAEAALQHDMAYAISWPSIASMNWEGKLRWFLA